MYYSLIYMNYFIILNNKLTMCAPFYSNEPIDTLDFSCLTTEELLNDEMGRRESSSNIKLTLQDFKYNVMKQI